MFDASPVTWTLLRKLFFRVCASKSVVHYYYFLLISVTPAAFVAQLAQLNVTSFLRALTGSERLGKALTKPQFLQPPRRADSSRAACTWVGALLSALRF